MPTLVKFLKSINREHRVTTSDPREAAQLRAEGYREVQPKKRQEQSSNSSQSESKKTSK
jgi:sRNA-binding carbon storage regulator CsrA